MNKVFAAALAALALIGSASLLTACNTVAGAGQDVSAAGHAVSTTADKAKP
ncbi:MAG: entericidin A/B family lipoprotein [Acidisphaera sp.]|nr:entericidin A/B family lipoprotein [Acidisphaera sp.]